jgi:cob(I)alamin adenosyltransferase
LTQLKIKDIHEDLVKVQNQLFSISSFIASYGDQKYYNLTDESILELERKIDLMEEQLSPLKNFILPGGSEESSHLHIGKYIVI